MRHRKAGRTLGRNASHRLALMRNLTRALIEHGRIITTVEKAKELRPFIEKLITLAKKANATDDRMRAIHLRRLAMQQLPDKASVTKLFKEIAPHFADRPGGYTRIIKRHERRLGDAGHTAFIELLKAGETKQTGAAHAPVAPKVATGGNEFESERARGLTRPRMLGPYARLAFCIVTCPPEMPIDDSGPRHGGPGTDCHGRRSRNGRSRSRSRRRWRWQSSVAGPVEAQSYSLVEAPQANESLRPAPEPQAQRRNDRHPGRPAGQAQASRQSGARIPRAQSWPCKRTVHLSPRPPGITTTPARDNRRRERHRSERCEPTAG